MAPDIFYLKQLLRQTRYLILVLFRYLFLFPSSLSTLFSYCLSSTISINVMTEVLSSVLGKDRDFFLPSAVKIFGAHQSAMGAGGPLWARRADRC